MSDTGDSLMQEVRQDLRDLAKAFQDLRNELTQFTVRMEAVPKLEAAIEGLKAQVESLQRWRGWLMGILAGSGLLGGAAAGHITARFASPAPAVVTEAAHARHEDARER